MLLIFLKCTFNQKEKRSFIWPKTSNFLFWKPSNFYSKKKSCSLKVPVSKFQKYKEKLLSIFVKSLKNNHEHELFHRHFSVFVLPFRNTCLKELIWVTASIYFNKAASINVKIPHYKLFQGEYLFPGGSSYLIVNKYWESSYFPVNDYWPAIFSGQHLLMITPVLKLRKS